MCLFFCSCAKLLFVSLQPNLALSFLYSYLGVEIDYSRLKTYSFFLLYPLLLRIPISLSLKTTPKIIKFIFTVFSQKIKKSINGHSRDNKGI